MTLTSLIKDSHKYCAKCGRYMVERQMPLQYDRTTGQPLMCRYWMCVGNCIGGDKILLGAIS